MSNVLNTMQKAPGVHRGVAAMLMHRGRRSHHESGLVGGPATDVRVDSGRAGDAGRSRGRPREAPGPELRLHVLGRRVSGGSAEGLPRALSGEVRYRDHRGQPTHSLLQDWRSGRDGQHHVARRRHRSGWWWSRGSRTTGGLRQAHRRHASLGAGNREPLSRRRRRHRFGRAVDQHPDLARRWPAAQHRGRFLRRGEVPGPTGNLRHRFRLEGDDSLGLAVPAPRLARDRRGQGEAGNPGAGRDR